MMFHLLLFLGSLMLCTHSKTIFPWNLTTISKKIATTRPMETSTVLDQSTTMEYEEQTTTTTARVKDKPYEFQYNFSQNNDSAFVSLYSNTTNMLVSINNTFSRNKYDQYPCEILFNEYSIRSNSTKTTILIQFNGTFSRDLATQLGDRLIDMAEILLTIRMTDYQNHTPETA